MKSNGVQSTRSNGIAAYAIFPPNRSRTAATACPRKSLIRAGIAASELAQARGRRQQLDPVADGIAGQEPLVEQAQLGAGDEDDLGSPPAQALGPFGAVGEQVEHLVVGQVAGERREPDLQAGVGGEAGGDLQSLRSPPVTRTALQCRSSWMIRISRFTTVGVERLAGAHPGVDEAGVVADALASHVPRQVPVRSVHGAPRNPALPADLEGQSKVAGHADSLSRWSALGCSACAEDIPELGGECVRVARLPLAAIEAAVAARKCDRLRAQLLGNGECAAVRHLAV